VLKEEVNASAPYKQRLCSVVATGATVLPSGIRQQLKVYLQPSSLRCLDAPQVH